jgi:cytidine deaminase
MDNEKLMEYAKEARTFSYAEISSFKVGASLLTKSGRVFLGCNIEDPSGIGVTNICAERCTIVKALSEGYRDFEKIAVVGGKDKLVFCTPCGVCRQYLNTFCPEIKVICIDDIGAVKEYSLKELLPYSFSEKF